MKTYKGFDKDLKCRGFQYEIGGEYETDKAKCCEEGFHACENPLDVFSYYPPAGNRFCEVEQSGEVDKSDDDSKIASTKIKIGAEIGLSGIIKAAFSFVKEKCDKKIEGGNYSALEGGNYSALEGGYGSALKGGDCSALKGGNYSALKGGDCSALKGGNYSALKGGYGSALKGGNYSALEGGNYSALKGGDCSALKGGNCSVIYGGEGAKVRGGLRSVLAVQQWEDGEFKRIVFAEVDGKKIKADTFYTLKNGEFQEVSKE